MTVAKVGYDGVRLRMEPKQSNKLDPIDLPPENYTIG